MIILPLRGAIKFEKDHHIFSKKRFWAAKSRFSMHKRSQSERNLLSSDRRCLHKRLEMPVHVTVFAASPPLNLKKWWFLNFWNFWKILKIKKFRFAERFVGIKMIHTIVFSLKNASDFPVSHGASRILFFSHFIFRNHSAKRSNHDFQYFSKIKKLKKIIIFKKIWGKQQKRWHV